MGAIMESKVNLLEHSIMQNRRWRLCPKSVMEVDHIKGALWRKKNVEITNYSFLAFILFSDVDNGNVRFNLYELQATVNTFLHCSSLTSQIHFLNGL